jgi:hypothetical protein
MKETTGMTTPLEREILTHYWAYPGEFRGGRQNWSVGIREIVERFIRLGLLEEKFVSGEGTGIFANQPALAAYMEALAKVPLPVQQWVVPE